MGGNWVDHGLANFADGSPTPSLDLVRFLPSDGELPQLHFCELVETTSDGLGNICAKIPFFIGLPDIELHWTDRGLFPFVSIIADGSRNGASEFLDIHRRDYFGGK